MYLLENVRLALSSLRSNKFRSILTMLGIIIGISAVITITTIGNSLKDTFIGAFNSMVGRLVFTSYTMLDDTPEENYRRMDDDEYITSAMLDELEEKFDGKYLVVRENMVGSGTLRKSSSKVVNVEVYGAYEGFIRDEKNYYKLVEGRYPSEEDNRQKKHTAIVSTLFAEQYFGKGKDPIGEDIDININGVGKVHFNIVGLYKLSDSYFRGSEYIGTKQEDLATPVFIPYYTSTRLKEASKDSTRYPRYYINSKKISSQDAVKEIQAFYDEKYANSELWIPFIYDFSDDMDEIEMYINILTVVLAVIAAISLLVGGIGVMNIMMVSITERTREIGIRKALGAKNSTIRTQFLIESSILCLVGGGIGVLIGMLNGKLVEVIGNLVIKSNPEYADVLSLDIRVSVTAIIASLIFSTIIGVFFGIYPAGKAAKLDPIEALRYE